MMNVVNQIIEAKNFLVSQYGEDGAQKLMEKGRERIKYVAKATGFSPVLTATAMIKIEEDPVKKLIYIACIEDL